MCTTFRTLWLLAIATQYACPYVDVGSKFGGLTSTSYVQCTDNVTHTNPFCVRIPSPSEYTAIVYKGTSQSTMPWYVCSKSTLEASQWFNTSDVNGKGSIDLYKNFTWNATSCGQNMTTSVTYLSSTNTDLFNKHSVQPVVPNVNTGASDYYYNSTGLWKHGKGYISVFVEDTRFPGQNITVNQLVYMDKSSMNCKEQMWFLGSRLSPEGKLLCPLPHPNP